VRRPVLTLLLLSFATFGIGLGRQAITEADEAYYAEAAREMVDSGDWITPRFNFEDRWQKPALYYWLTAATYLATGPGEASARLWSAVSGAALVLLVWATAARSATFRLHAWLAGAITATSFGYFAMARSALPDLPLAFCITLTITSVCAAFDAERDRPGAGLRGWLVAGIGVGLGCLMKGPVAIVVPALVVVPVWALERRTSPLRGSHVVAAAVLATTIALPWYLAMVARHGTAYLQSFLVGDNLERFTTTRFNETRPIWFYLPVIAGGLLPWSAYGIAALRDLVRRHWRPSRDELRLIVWAVVPTIFFIASVGQQPRYVLPVLPPLAILLAGAIGDRAASTAGGRTKPVLAAGTWTTAVLFVLSSALLYRLHPLLGETPAAVFLLAMIATTASGGALALIALRQAWTLLPVTLIACAVALLLALQYSVLAPGRPAAVERMASLVRAHRAGGEPVAAFHAFTRNLVFYLGFAVRDMHDAAPEAARFLASTERVLLVVPEQDLPALAASAPVAPRTLARVQYFNTANLRLRTVLRPDPEAELETVLLVANR
jgi:4-amino-4-deoxy-L-arabinose transferase-like glycosyltransferase